MNNVRDTYLKYTSSVYEARKILRAEIGDETIRLLHKHNFSLDVASIVVPIILFLLDVSYLASHQVGLLWILLFFLQGVLAQLMMLVSHDLFVHRRFGGERVSWVCSMLLTIPRFSLPSGYEQAHLNHHKYIGTDRDTEAYKQDLDSVWKRWLFSTAPGIKLAQSNKFGKINRDHYHNVEDGNEAVFKKAKLERLVMRGWLVALLPLSYFYFDQVVYGYVLPMILVVPILNSFRIIIEHADINPENPFNQSTGYKTGILTRCVFLWDSGDCHIVHHVFPRMPWYRVGKAVDLFWPIFEKYGVVKRTSYLQLLQGWYLSNYAHRTLWPLEPK